jgi:hypothetical protein
MLYYKQHQWLVELQSACPVLGHHPMLASGLEFLPSWNVPIMMLAHA